ncbi:MAG: ABC transporter ATP-binding protein [Sulfurimonadaceae bacterium]|nr:ABC transporter ATP-binding protein [Sulfurimonadaceae bacterium]
MKEISFSTIFKLVAKNKPTLIYGQIFTLLAILISIPIPLLLPILVDEVLLDKPALIITTIDGFFGSGSAFYYIALVGFAVVALRFLYYLLSVLTTKIFTKIAKYVTFMIRKQLLEHLQIVSMNEYEVLGSGTITSNLITDVNTLDSFIITTISRFVASILTLIAVSIVLFMMDPILGLFILIFQPVIMFISKKMSRRVGGLKKEENQAIAEFQEEVGETLELFGQIKASDKERYFFEQALIKADAIQKTSNQFGYKSVAYERFSYTLFLIFYEILRMGGLLLVAYSDLSIGMMFAMFGYIWFITSPVQDILSMQYAFASAKTAIERLNTILALKTEASGERIIDSDALTIDAKNLYFSYDKPILKAISLTIPAGSKIALIGASGSGKTTLAQVLAGFYEKESGELFYNGIPIEKLNKRSLRQRVFLVLQMPILFNATLRFNITMGDESIKDETILKALHKAQLAEMIANMPKGLDTVVGRHGIRLSGGQRQRISIARMLVVNPSIVIFDESTSALDVHTEVALQNALESVLKDKTVITIAHRLSTVKNADTIYVLENGNIVQHGTHEELEEKEGHYREFIKRQLL